jgi:hypothetical protein
LALPADPAVWRSIGRHGLTLLNLEDESSIEPIEWEGWAGYVAWILAGGRISLLAGELDRPRPGLTCADLGALADELSSVVDPPAGSTDGAKGARQPVEDDIDRSPSEAVADDPLRQRADAAHARFEGTGAAVVRGARPSAVENLMATLAAQPPEVLELLERIDDLVFAAINGDRRALDELEVLWPTVAADLDHDLVEQSREQYLRCALSIWSECVDGQVQRPERAVSAIDVLCVLFEE